MGPTQGRRVLVLELPEQKWSSRPKANADEYHLMTEGRALRLSGYSLAKSPKPKARKLRIWSGPADSVVESCKCEETLNPTP